MSEILTQLIGAALRFANGAERSVSRIAPSVDSSVSAKRSSTLRNPRSVYYQVHCSFLKGASGRVIEMPFGGNAFQPQIAGTPRNVMTSAAAR